MRARFLCHHSLLSALLVVSCLLASLPHCRTAAATVRGLQEPQSRIIVEDIRFLLGFSSSDQSCTAEVGEMIRSKFEDCLRIYTVLHCTVASSNIGLGNPSCDSDNILRIKGAVFTFDEENATSETDAASCAREAARSDLCIGAFRYTLKQLTEISFIEETHSPSVHPSLSPSKVWSSAPSTVPSSAPSKVPSTRPTSLPSGSPTLPPSLVPTKQPSLAPTTHPSLLDSSIPFTGPTLKPLSSVNPSKSPSLDPIVQESPDQINPPSLGLSPIPSEGSLKPTTVTRTISPNLPETEGPLNSLQPSQLPTSMNVDSDTPSVEPLDDSMSPPYTTIADASIPDANDGLPAKGSNTETSRGMTLLVSSVGGAILVIFVIIGLAGHRKMRTVSRRDKSSSAENYSKFNENGLQSKDSLGSWDERFCEDAALENSPGMGFSAAEIDRETGDVWFRNSDSMGSDVVKLRQFSLVPGQHSEGLRNQGNQSTLEGDILSKDDSSLPSSSERKSRNPAMLLIPESKLHDNGLQQERLERSPSAPDFIQKITPVIVEKQTCHSHFWSQMNSPKVPQNPILNRYADGFEDDSNNDDAALDTISEKSSNKGDTTTEYEVDSAWDPDDTSFNSADVNSDLFVASLGSAASDEALLDSFRQKAVNMRMEPMLLSPKRKRKTDTPAGPPASTSQEELSVGSAAFSESRSILGSFESSSKYRMEFIAAEEEI